MSERWLAEKNRVPAPRKAPAERGAGNPSRRSEVAEGRPLRPGAQVDESRPTVRGRIWKSVSSRGPAKLRACRDSRWLDAQRCTTFGTLNESLRRLRASRSALPSIAGWRIETRNEVRRAAVRERHRAGRGFRRAKAECRRCRALRSPGRREAPTEDREERRKLSSHRSRTARGARGLRLRNALWPGGPARGMQRLRPHRLRGGAASARSRPPPATAPGPRPVPAARLRDGIDQDSSSGAIIHRLRFSHKGCVLEGLWIGGAPSRESRPFSRLVDLDSVGR